MFYKTHNLIIFSPFLHNLTKLQLDWKRLTGLGHYGSIFHKLFAHTVASLVNMFNKKIMLLRKRAKMVLVEMVPRVCVCVCVCGHVYVVYEDTNVYNDMGMT